MARVRSAKRLDALRTRWRNASLKTSFMVYMLGVLLRVSYSHVPRPAI